MNVVADRTELRRAFGREVSSYEVDPIDPHLRIHSVTGGVFRVRAGADSRILKVVRHGAGSTPDGLWGAGAEETHRNYWKREWLAFDSGLLGSLPGELRAPRAALTTQRGDDECWIWMEDVSGRTGSTLQPDDYSTIAHALGTTQGAYAAGNSPLPTHPWLSRDWLRGWVAICARFIDAVHDDASWGDPALGSMRPLRPRILGLWAHRDELFAIADEPPQTLVHWDFWPTNVFVHDDDVVAIDWSQVGISGVTHDLDQLTLDPVWMLVRPDEAIDVLEDRVLPAYASGLQSQGLDVSAKQVHRWYAAAAALRYAWMAGAQPAVVTDRERRRAQEDRFGRDVASVIATKARVVEHALSLGEGVLDR